MSRDPYLPHFKDQCRSVPPERRPPPNRDPDGVFLAVGESSGNAAIRGEREEHPPPPNNIDVLCRGGAVVDALYNPSGNIVDSSANDDKPSLLTGWATVNPSRLGVDTTPYAVPNLVNGQWTRSETTMKIIHPLKVDAPAPLFTIPDTSLEELPAYFASLSKATKSGMHNPLKHPERYLMLGEVSRQVGNLLSMPVVAEFFVQLIMTCVPKSHAQAMGEVQVTAAFLHNFAGDNVRLLAKSFGVPGDHYGQTSHGLRWPWGAVAIVCPLNFPLEIPALHLMGSLYMGNLPCIKPSEACAVVVEQFVRLLHHCGLPLDNVDILNGRGAPTAQHFICASDTPIRFTQFTGSPQVAELLSRARVGKIRMEDAGLDWKILGPDVDHVDYVAWQCDQDAVATSGQKYPTQSIMFVHQNWTQAGLLDKLQAIAAQRRLDDFSLDPILTHMTESILQHTAQVLKIPGARLLFGGNELAKHKYEPAAVFVPLDQLLQEQHFEVCCTELFAPFHFQVITEYNDAALDSVLEACERMSHPLTAAVVSNDPAFCHRVLANTANGTTYVGRRARITCAPRNCSFGPAGDPRSCGIATPEAIQMVWSCHREIVYDHFVPSDWKQGKAV